MSDPSPKAPPKSSRIEDGTRRCKVPHDCEWPECDCDEAIRNVANSSGVRKSES
jgi:hypothetical protein